MSFIAKKPGRPHQLFYKDLIRLPKHTRIVKHFNDHDDELVFECVTRIFHPSPATHPHPHIALGWAVQFWLELL